MLVCKILVVLVLLAIVGVGYFLLRKTADELSKEQ